MTFEKESSNNGMQINLTLETYQEEKEITYFSFQKSKFTKPHETRIKHVHNKSTIILHTLKM